MLKRLLPFAIVFLVIETLLRISLLTRAIFDVEFDPQDIAIIMVRGLWFDMVTASFCLLPLVMYYLVLPASQWMSKGARTVDVALRFVFCFTLLFDAVAEHLFWSEFSTRFNFIAVDYLIYTKEVIGNIVESYPLPALLAAIAAAAGVLTFMMQKWMPLVSVEPVLAKRAKHTFGLITVCAALYMASSIDQMQLRDNAEGSEIAANGIYNLFYAYRHNEINYERFYASRAENDIANNARNLLWEEEGAFVHPDGKDLTRTVFGHGDELNKNVIIVVMESMSADYMTEFGSRDVLTPNLDRLSKEGLFFSNLYATGTRTVRGLEAVTLSIPPTPGQSIVRRPDNENLFSLGFIFKDRGYDTSFIYGGYGYFDNMNAFFAGNGFDVLDRTSVQSNEVQFANVWGICDEDMFAQAIKRADQSYASHKPFMQLIMTTSNHRPYTYPEGRIDIASHSGRFGGVKYADYSIGKLIENAKGKPWFKDTVFVFVADHTAGVGGKAELDPRKYHIPLIYYSPGFIKPQRYEAIASQIDTGPVLLGLLNFNYYTKFYGEDLLHDPDEVPHAFISNYQKVALIRDNGLTVLAPKHSVEQYSWPNMEAQGDEDQTLALDTITYYQTASWWRGQYRRIPTKIPLQKHSALQ